MRPFFHFGIVIASLLLSAALSAQTAPSWPLPETTPAVAGFSSERLDLLHQNFRQAVDEGKYSGYIILLARDGKIADWRTYGWQDLAAKAPMQKDSIVKMFSMSKLITSTAVLILLEEGRLKLDDPVEKYLPALKGRKVFTGGTADAPTLVDAERPVTIRDLLTHTSGYYYDGSLPANSPVVELCGRAKIWDAANLDEFVARVALLPLHEQPGTRFRYGISTDLLGAVIEKISGQRLDVFFQQRIFAPLGMRDSGFWVPAEKRTRLATIYHREAGILVPNAHTNQNRVGPDHGVLSGGGGLYSTAADYVRFAQMLLNGGQLDGVRILGRKTVELMTASHIAHLADPHPNGVRAQGFGLGVRVITDLGESPTLDSVGGFGWDGAATTKIHIDPKERMVLLLLCAHVPFNEDDIFSRFFNGCYSALND
ncbi:MAG: serine hydrolase [Opitutaceae bacterium]|nr:serine hydrolase [Opitutaceae bacterium]